MKTKPLFRRAGWLLTICMLAGACLFSSGCTTILVTQKAKGNSNDRTYAPASLVSAETLPNGDLQFTAHGYLKKDRDKDSAGADYTLVVSKADLDAARKDAAGEKTVREEVMRETLGTIRATRTEARQPDGVALPVETLRQGANQDKILEILKGAKPVVLAMIIPSEKPKNKDGTESKNGTENKDGTANNDEAKSKSPRRDSMVIFYSEPLSSGGRHLIVQVVALKKPAPAFYALTPVSAAIDLATSPLQIAIGIVAAIVMPPS